MTDVKEPALADGEVAAWQRLGVARVSDAMEAMGMRRSVVTGMRTTAPDAVTVGPALTIRQIIKHVSAKREDKLVRHAKTIRSGVTPGTFMVMDAGGFDDLSSWGENHSRFCMNHGIVGLLIDGCIRDAAIIRRMGFPAYCRGFTPFKSQWDLETAAIGEPVMIGRVQVRTGDLIVADEDGAIVVPQERRQSIFEAAREVAAEEERNFGL